MLSEISLEHIWGAVLTTVVAGIIKLIFDILKEQKAKREREEAEKTEIIKALVTYNKELVQWREKIEADSIALRSEIQLLNNKINLITKADLVIMKDRIISLCKTFINKGYILLSYREHLTEMYNLYTAMGGNGSGKIMYEYVMTLPIKDINEVNDILQEKGGDGHVEKSNRNNIHLH